MKNILGLILIMALPILSKGQNVGKINGRVIDAQSREPIPYVSIGVPGAATGAMTNDSGYFSVPNVPLGYQSIVVNSIGYKPYNSDQVLVAKDRTPFINVSLEPDIKEQETLVVEIKQDVFKEDKRSPVSKQTLTVTEIEKNPGANRDISRVIESLPGVASSSSFRNDIVIRGGSPVENSFYLDGVEVPVINHFQTQGASGGPVGILNANLIKNVEFRSGAFPVHRGNTLSSVIEFKQKVGNAEKTNTRFTIGSSDIGLTLDGPLSEKTTYIASVRQSYLQFLFSALDLPFLPTFNDIQFNIRNQRDENNEFQIIGLGALDRFKLNASVNDDLTDPEQIKFNNYTLQNIPVQQQWNYTVGAVWTHYGKNAKQRYVLSRNSWNNNSIKYQDNDDSDPSNLLLDYNSNESEVKFRFESIGKIKKYDYVVGFGTQNANYTNSTYQQITVSGGQTIIDFDSKINFFKYAGFAQVNRSYADDKLTLGLGLRMDGSSYNNEMAIPFNQLSPRFTLSYLLSNKIKINASAALYHQLPAYTILGYRDNSGELVNQQNGVQYIQAEHLIAGLEFRPDENTRITAEGFYKNYSKYPFSITDSVSLANIGSDFGVVGNEEVTSTSEGRAYGLELLIQRRSASGLYGILAYTLVRSEFADFSGNYIPTAWDNRHLLTFTGGIKLNKNWQLGGKLRLIGGRPYTPYDYANSSLIANWDINNQALYDNSQLNTLRQGFYNQFDVRIDKTWFKDKYSLNLYLDIQNIYNFQLQEQPILTTQKDANGTSIVDPSDSSRYLMEELANTSGLLLPTIGVIIDF